MKTSILKSILALAIAASFASCKKDDVAILNNTITIENVLDSKPLVESGTFMGEGTPAVVLPGQICIVFVLCGKKPIHHLCKHVWLEQRFVFRSC